MEKKNNPKQTEDLKKTDNQEAKKEEDKSKKLPPEPIPKADPEEYVSTRMQYLFGVSKRLLVPRRLPIMRADKPYILDSKNGEVTIINAPLRGSLTAEDDRVDPFKNQLRVAEADGHSAVWIVSDLMYMLSQRYGTNRPFWAQTSGIKVDPKRVEELYPKSVVNDPQFQRVADRLKKGDPVFIPLSLRLELNLDLVQKSFLDESGKPLFSGPVFITFGKLEDDFIKAYANEFSRVGYFKTKAWVQRRIKELEAEWRVARKSGDRDGKDKKAIEIKEYKEFLDILAVMNNIADESINKAREIVTSYLIKSYEERIPNARVISIGDAFLKNDSHVIMSTTDKTKEGFRGKVAETLVKRTAGYHKGRKLGTIPNLMIGTGLNPYMETQFVTFQASTTPKDKRMCTIIQAPICLDDELYRDLIRDRNKLSDPITRVASQPGFKSGAISVKWQEGIATPIITFWGSTLLKNREIFKSRKSIIAMVKGKKKKHKLMYTHKKGCTHLGAADVMTFKSPNDPIFPVKYFHQVSIELLQGAKAPISQDLHDGDGVQGVNHPYWGTIHPGAFLPEELTIKLNSIKCLKEMREFVIEQRILQGTPQLMDQMRSYSLSLKPYLDYFIDIVQRNRKLKIEYKGSLSAVMHIMGNHIKNSVHKKLGIVISDAEHMTALLKILLLKRIIDRKLYDLSEDIDSQLTSPQYGPLGEGRGSFGVKGYQHYSRVLKHKQGNPDKTQERAHRRSVNENEVSLPVINDSGDNHKGNYRVTRDTIHIKTGGNQDEGAFGREIDFSEQNVFSTVYGIPVGGLENGPVVFITLDQETIRNYALKPVPIDGKALFKNALE